MVQIDPSINEEAQEVHEQRPTGGRPTGGTKQPNPNPLACGMCIRIVGQVAKSVGDNFTSSKIQAAAQKACQAVGAQSWCSDRFFRSIKVLIGMLSQRAKPASICKAMKLCNRTGGGNRPTFMVQIDPSINEEEQETAVHEESNSETFGDKCSACMNVIDSAKSYLTDKSSAGVQRAVRAACSRVPFASSVCTAILGQYMTAITGDLLNKTNSGSICSKIRMCSA